MTCAACQANVTKVVSKLDGVDAVNVNLLSHTMTVDFDESTVSSDDIIKAVVSIGYAASLFDENGNKQSRWDKRKELSISETKTLKKRLISSVVLLLPLMYVSMGGMLSLPMPAVFKNGIYNAVIQMILALVVMIINRKFFISGFKGLIKLAPNMDSLVAIGSGASFAFSLYVLINMITDPLHSQHHLYFESAAMILTLVTVGKYLESISKNKTSSALEKLVNLAPKTATVLVDGVETTVMTDSISVGDLVLVKPGDIVAVDGIIVEGNGFLDQSAVTGESLPVEKKVGDTVISATKNKNGRFVFKALKVGEETTLSQIINLVDDASSSKAPIARVADKVSGYFVPIVILVSLITAICWIIAGKGFEFSLTSAVSVLVISCPCALGLATPVAIMVGTGKAANMGILINSAESLENLHKINTVVFDKTGTVTQGEPAVSSVLVCDKNLKESDFLKISASLESGSSHPYAVAIIEKYGKKDYYNLEDFNLVEGRGISAKLENKLYFAGNAEFMAEKAIVIDEETAFKVAVWQNDGHTVLYFAENDKILGIIALSDEIRQTSKMAVETLRKMNIETVMLTGDNHKTAETVKKAVGIDRVIAEVLPAEKEGYIRNLQTDGKKVAMVGDGINDAPALARANVGIAIGAGSDIAVETADIVLIKDEPLDVVNAIMLSRAVFKNIKLNLFWAFIYNIIGIPVAAGLFYNLLGLQLSPMLASAAMSLSSLFVVTNALRLRKFKGLNLIEKSKEEQKMEKIMVINGMMCMHCKANVEKTLLAIDGVSDVAVSLEDKTATVTFSKDVANDVLVSAITDAGYEVISCK